LVENIENWQKWSPIYSFDYDIINRRAKTAYGSEIIWKNKQDDITTGFIKCINVVPYEQLTYSINISKENNATVSFLFEESNGKTKITCLLQGRLQYPFHFLKFYKEKFFASLIEQGLVELKRQSESLGRLNIKISITSVPDQKILAIRDTVSMNKPEVLNIALGTAYAELFEFVNPKNNIQFAGPPLEIIITTEPEYSFDAAIPIIAPDNIIPSGRVKINNLTGGKMVKAIYQGTYRNINMALKVIECYIYKNNLDKNGNMWMEYINDPVRTPPEELITNIYIPVK
jgi:effector-binding domain-containing protein